MKPNDRERPRQRRTFLKTAVALSGTGLLVGCTGGGSGGDGADGGNGDGADGGSGNGNGDTTGSGDGGSETTATATEASESSFPERQIKLIIPFSSGGGYDAYTRLAARYLPKHLPTEVNVQVQNVEGAGGIIGTEQIYNAEPDGYTNGIINVSKLGRDQIISDVDFDLTQMTYYATVALEVPLITLGKHVDVDSWEGFVERVGNGELLFGTTGPASTTAANAYLPGEVSGAFSIDDVLDNMVVYDGTAEMIQGILREDVDVLAVAYSSALAYIRDDSVKPLLYLGMDEQPPEDIPDTDTLATAGVENGQEIADMVPPRRAFGGPPDMPEERVTILRDAFEAVLSEDEEMRSASEEADRPITFQNGEETTAAVEGYVNGWKNRQDLLDKIQGA